MTLEAVTVPDLGGADEVEVIEIAVAVGDRVEVDQTLVTLESDKASMDMPAPLAGVVKAIKVVVGDRVSTGHHVFDIEIETGEVVATAESTSESITPEAPSSEVSPAPATIAEMPDPVSAVRDIVVPDLGGADQVEVVEVNVSAGDTVEEGDGLMVLEGDKASMDLPAPAAGVIVSLAVSAGQSVASGDVIGRMSVVKAESDAVEVATPSPSPSPASAAPMAAVAAAPVAPPTQATTPSLTEGDGLGGLTASLERSQKLVNKPAALPNPAADIYAGPAVRNLARDFGVNLSDVTGSGPKGRILKEDVQTFVKSRLSQPVMSAQPAGGGGIPPVPEVDFSAFGPVEEVKLNSIQKATVTAMSRSWLNAPRVTQFDFADVSELEAFRASLKAEMEQRGNKLTPLPFLLLAVARALREHPKFKASLHPEGDRIVMKHYCHIGVAVDTPQGLVVPVIRDVDQKTVWELAAEARELAGKARDRKLRAVDMQGGCFTISSLGNIGGEGFTPIVNAPEVAILGVSKMAVRPVWDGSVFQPRQTLPLSLSYDHKVINGADAGAFMTYLVGVLADIRRLLL